MREQQGTGRPDRNHSGLGAVAAGQTLEIVVGSWEVAVDDRVIGDWQFQPQPLAQLVDAR